MKRNKGTHIELKESERVFITVGNKKFDISLNLDENGLVINKVDFEESSQIVIYVNVSNEIEIQ